MKLVGTQPWSEEKVAEFRAIAPDLEYVNAWIPRGAELTEESWVRELPRFLEAVAGADVVIGSFGSSSERVTEAADAGVRLYGGGGIFQQMMRAAGHRIRWVHCNAAGVEKLMCPEFLASRTVMTCTKGEALGSTLAEAVIARVLFYMQGFPAALESRSWAGGRSVQPIELRGRTLGIVGFGGTGQALARLANAFGMDVIATRRRPTPPPPGVRALSGPEGLDDLLRQSDVVALTVASTPETRGMIGLRELRLMKRTAVLVNVARGDIVELDALVTALREDLIAFAALDVVAWPEPWGPDMPLWGFKNVLITPHNAGTGLDRIRHNEAMVRENFRRFVRGEEMLGVVDKTLQY